MVKKYFYFNLHSILLLCLLIVSGLILQSCAGSQKHRSGKLSDAMEKSSDEHEGERKVDTQPDPEDEDDEDEYFLGIDSVHLTTEEGEWLELFRSLPAEAKELVVGFVKVAVQQAKERKQANPLADDEQA